MEKYPETARGKPQFGSNKNKTKELWEEFAVELNSLGPPSRTAQEWGRVWIHYKANLKRKLANNRNNLVTTGSGPSQEIALSPLEESVAELIQVREQVASVGRSFGVENTPPIIDKEGDNTVSFAEQIKYHDVDRPTSSAPQAIKSRKGKSLEAERVELLKKQAQVQSDLLKKIGQLEKTVNKNYEINKKLLQLLI